jgi:septal ring factor EnvC (AmiA/AmiB activator)
MPPTKQMLAKERTYADVDGVRTLIAVPGQPVPTQFQDLVDPATLTPVTGDETSHDLIAAAEATRTALVDTEDRLKELREQLDTATAEKTDLRTQLDTAIADKAELEKDLAESDQALDKATADLAAVKLELDEVRAAAADPPPKPPAEKPAAPSEKAQPAPAHDKARKGAQTKGA